MAVTVAGVNLGLSEAPASLWVGIFAFGLTTNCVVVLWLVVTVYDPALGAKPQTTSSQFECKACNQTVPANVKHCGQCNKCVHGFDHHCKVLNTCVGESNYRMFISLLVAYLINTSVLIGQQAALNVLPIWANTVFLVVQSGKLISASLLLAWHAYMRILGVSTFQFLNERTLMRNIQSKLRKNEINQAQYDYLRQQIQQDRSKPILLWRNSKVIHMVDKDNVQTQQEPSQQMESSLELTKT